MMLRDFGCGWHFEMRMFIKVAAIALRTICVILSMIFVAAITAVYLPVFRVNYYTATPGSLAPLFTAFFGALVPTSFILAKGRPRETMMMVGSFGWVISMGAWFVTIYGWSLTGGAPVFEVLQGYSGPLWNFIFMMLFAVNGLLSLRSLRRARHFR